MSISLPFYNKLNRFNNTGALMLVSSYDIKINYFEIAFLCKNVKIVIVDEILLCTSLHKATK